MRALLEASLHLARRITFTVSFSMWLSLPFPLTRNRYKSVEVNEEPIDMHSRSFSTHFHFLAMPYTTPWTFPPLPF